MIRSSFASFNAAKLAIQANQSALALVGQNMANVKTEGYTRQRLDQISLNFRGISSFAQATPEARIGYGVSVIGVSQIRDPFLDTRYRLEMGNLGTYDKRAELLDKMGNVFDETDKSGLDMQFQDMLNQLQAMANAPTSSNDSMVRSSAQNLVGIFRRYSKQLDEVSTYAADSVQKDVNGINDILKEIQQLNITIKNSQVHGNPALELQDSRNVLIDQLATYANIKVTQTTDTTLTGAQVGVMKIDFMTDNGVAINLIDDVKSPAEFSFLKPDASDPDGDYRISITDSIGGVYRGVSSDKGTILSSLGMLNDKGVYDSPSNTNNGIGYYKDVLNNMAQQFAKSFNDMNTVTGPPAKGGPLFSANDGSGVITAANITISDEWLNGTVNLLPSRSTDPNTPSDDITNINNMINLLKDDQKFRAPDGSISFEGTFQKYFTNMVDTQAMDQKSTTTILDNYMAMTKEVANSKDSVSGVNLDEEAMNMMQYNTSLTAASRLMTTLDEALNTIINSMGVVGR